MIIKTPDALSGFEARALLLALEESDAARVEFGPLWASCSDTEARDAVHENLSDFGPHWSASTVYTARPDTVPGRAAPYRRALPFDTLERRFKCLEGPGGGLLHDWAAVRDLDPAQVWTVVDCDGQLMVAPGIHFVNRMDYLVTLNKRGSGHHADYIYN